jgi:hypothetical protein
MRKILSISFAVIALSVFLYSCQKDEVIQDVASLGKGSYVTLVKNNNLILDATKLTTSTVSIDVKEYGEAQDKLIVYVSKGNANTDRTVWKKLKEYPNAGGTYNLSVTGAEIAAATGTTPAPGDTYTLYNQVVTKDGRTFDLANTFPDFANLPNYNMALRWSAVVVCPFIPADAAGTYTITADNWDGASGETAEVTATANSATITYAFPYAASPGVNPLVLTIDPATGGVTVAKQVYGSYGAGFENFAAEGTGFFFSCTGTIDLSLKHTLGATNYGTYTLRLKK